jgi:hypothetical protein
MILHVLIAMVAGWRQQQGVTCLLPAHRVLKDTLGGLRHSGWTGQRRAFILPVLPYSPQRAKQVWTRGAVVQRDFGGHSCPSDGGTSLRGVRQLAWCR